MLTHSYDCVEFESLEARLRIMLPEIYRDRSEEIQPVSMGSAGLKYGDDGRVAWDEMWESFCDLAMAGGPPHRGTLLEPGRKEEIEAQAARSREVLDEMCRGITLVTGLYARQGAMTGWIRVDCTSAAMAGWLVRAIVMENVAAYSRGLALHLPVGPEYRLEKEIKNVVTVIAKTCHYWLEHTSYEQKQEIADLLRAMEKESPLLEPAWFDAPANGDELEVAIGRVTQLPVSNHRYAGWLGLDCSDVRGAIRMMRALVVSNVLSRREGTLVFVPVNPGSDPRGERAAKAVSAAYRFVTDTAA